MTTVAPPVTVTADNWRTFAVCAMPGVEPDLFWPVAPTTAAGNAQIREALAICRHCPAQRPCYEWAWKTGARNQVIGGHWFSAGGHPKTRPPDIARPHPKENQHA